MDTNGPILRIFEVKTKPEHASRLLENFATTSADVVRNEPGNLGYFFGNSLPEADGEIMFVSVWKDLASIKQRFGESWQDSFLPEGYEDLIETCSIRHLVAGSNWHVTLPEKS